MTTKETKRDTLPGGKVTRINPDTQQPKRHRHRYKHTKIGPAPTKLENNVDEYELESIPPDDDRLSVFTIRSRSPSIEIIKLPPPISHPSRLTLHHQDILSSYITKEPTTYRSFVISPNSQLLREVSLIPIETIPVKDENTYETAQPEEKTLNVEPATVIFVLLALSFIISICIIVVLAVLLAANNKDPYFVSNSFMSSACAVNCMMSPTPFLAPTIAAWPFDDNLYDINNIYSAIYTNPPTLTFNTGNIGRAVSFTEAQYVSANTHFMNLTYQSWTVEGWILISDLSVERGIFGQCESSTTTDQCLSLSIKDNRLHMSFYNNDLDGTTILLTSATKWRHVAFVYDYTIMQQSIYLDGVLEATTGASGIPVGAYKGTSGAVTIGWTTTGNYFNGRIDNLQVSSSAKTACQILNDATLTAYYAFDVSTTYLDSSVNFLHGTANLLLTLSGRVNDAYSFQYEYSYFQSTGFTAYSDSESFSVALWIKPYYVNGGTLIHLSSNTDGTTNCFDLLGLSSSGQLIGQLIDSGGSTKNIGGPTIKVNIWTHIVLTYSSSNGLALYTNGTMYGVTDAFISFPASTYYSSQPYMTVGNPRTINAIPGCTSGTPAVSLAAYRGRIDELRIYSRALTITEICSLFNP